jgi:hypothetical protein
MATRLRGPLSRIVLGVLAHASIEIGEVPIELLEREGESEDPLGVFDRKGARQAFAAHRYDLRQVGLERGIHRIERRRIATPGERRGAAAKKFARLCRDLGEPRAKPLRKNIRERNDRSAPRA